jgi:hypothetical protein
MRRLCQSAARNSFRRKAFIAAARLCRFRFEERGPQHGALDGGEVAGSGISDGPLDRAEERCELRAPSIATARLIGGLEPSDRSGKGVKVLRIEVADRNRQQSGELFKIVH